MGGKWIEWKGGECPVPVGVDYDIQFRSGAVYENNLNTVGLRWTHSDKGTANYAVDIVAYKLHGEEQPEEHPWIKNTGKRVVRKNVIVEVKFGDGSVDTGPAADYYWEFMDDIGNIESFRFTN